MRLRPYQKGFLLTSLLLFSCGGEFSLGAPLDAKVESILSKYCFDCHDDSSAKAKLSIESLAPDFSQAAWVKIHDRVHDGAMPPKDKPQPTPEERAEITRWLAGELTGTAQARQAADGRGLVRRMNRREYETTLHDLLGIATPLRDLLPEDSAVLGFDTVSRGLETSATHLLRFQEAADRALAAAVPPWPLTNQKSRQTGREFLDSRPKPNREGTAPFVRFEGDTIVLCAQLYKHGSVTTIRVPADGRYRVRASVRAVKNEGKPIPVLIGKISTDRFGHEKNEHILDIQDAPADRTRIVEIEAKLPQGEQIYVEGLSLIFFRTMEKERKNAPVGEDYAGPGLAVDWIELEGPLDAGVGYTRLFGDLPAVPSRYLADTLAGTPVKDDWRNKWAVPGEYSKYPLSPVSMNPKEDADRLIRAFLPLALRRPADEETAARFVKIAHDQIDAGETFGDSMLAAYKAILCSHEFLNYVEQPGKLDGYALAARLARFLWNSMPDAELFGLAASGELSKPETLRAQTERLLRDPKSARFARAFSDQWLDLGKFYDMKPDTLYVEYDETLAWSMLAETRAFFGEVLAKDLPTASFFHSDWTFLNARLARHYGLPLVDGLEMRRAALRPEDRRGGVITHASVLKLTTNASYTSPIKRGAWMLERLIGKPPPPPPPDVQAIEPDIRGATTIREQLDLHKNVASCAACHQHIDPPGFALENYDVVGGWRDRYRVKQGGNGNAYEELPHLPPGKKVWLAKAVEAGGETEDGRPFADLGEYKSMVLTDADQFTRNLAAKLIVYATGAGIDFADRAAVEDIVLAVKAKNHGFRSLIHEVVQSPVFLKK
jgi:hypothetical protein